MLIENVSPAWSAGVTLSAAEGWQCREGAVLVSTSGSGSDDRGVMLTAGQAWPFPSGATVYYRRVSSSPAAIAREAIA